MKVLVLSDVLFLPIEKTIRKIVPDWIISSEYHEDITIALLSLNISNISDFDFLFLHSDQNFHKKSIKYQSLLFNNIIDFCKINFNLKVVITNSWSNSYELAELSDSLGVLGDVNTLFRIQLENVKVTSNLYVLDIQGIIFKEGYSNLYNYSLGILYQMPYTKGMIQYFAQEFIVFFQFLTSEEKKVIVLDCDNTLWGGIIGEDGTEGIKCDNNASGIVYYKFQQFLKKRKEDGFLLCLCSKNNEGDVKEIFEKRSMPLIWDDFIIKKINWSEKYLNIRNIAKELNVGEDSMIFIDDNSFELDFVKECTSVNTTFKFSENYNDFLQLIHSYAFRRKQILEADKEKSKQYEIEQIRKSEELKFQSLDDFISSLRIRMDIRLNDWDDLERISQLTEKTNQFNFNKHPYSIPELINWINTGNFIYSLKLSDKFGDYGTVGIILIYNMGTEAYIENFLMSCRALGKNVEYQFFNFVLTELNAKEISLKEIFFHETVKNIPVKIFLKNSQYESLVKSIE